MKNSGKVALGGIIAALSLIIMLLGYIPSFQFAVPAVAGAVLIFVVIEVNVSFALGVYLVVSLLSFLIGEKESAVMFIAFLGYYPIIKAKLESLKSRILEWIIKFAIFNAAIFAAYFVMIHLLFVPLDTGFLGTYFVPAMVVLGNITFLIYDFGMTRIISMYIDRLHPKIHRYFGK